MGKEWYWSSGRSSKRSSSSSSSGGGGGVSVDRRRDTTCSSSATTTTTAGCMCAVFQMFDFHHFQCASNLQHHETQPSSFKSITRNATTTTFDLPEEPSVPKGAEAPRNSLKSEEGTSLSSIIEDEEVVQVEDHHFNNIQMGINQIKTSCGNNGASWSSSRSSAKSISGFSPAAAADFFSDTSSNSPGTKTPGLVARLMGLDLLPEDTNSPPPTSSTTANKYHQYLNLSTSHNSQSQSHTSPHRPRTALRNKARHLMDNNNNSGTRSLPETPRISSARRSDVDVHHHRLSLQINKENSGVGAADDLDFSRLSALRRKNFSKTDHHNHQDYCYESSSSSSTKSPGYYARHIVKQVKESVARKAGSDITNTFLGEYDHNNNRVKPKRSKLEEQASPTTMTSRSNNNNSSCSPRLIMNKDQTFHVSKPTLLSSSLLSNSPSPAAPQQEKGKRNKATAGSGGGGNRRTMVERIMQEETFVFGRPSNNKKKKTDQTNYKARANINIPDKIKTPLSLSNNNLLHINVVPTLLAVKKTTKDDQKIVQPGAEVPHPDDAQESKRIIMSTSHYSSSSKSQNDHHVSGSRDTSSSSAALRHYITGILGRTGISTTTHVSLANWFSPSHPLDPSIFHRLELHYSNGSIHLSNSRRRSNNLLGPRCNRKLAFDVVDELLAEILKPCMNLKPWMIVVSADTKQPRTRGSLGMQGKDLIDTLCSRVDGFPCKDCQVLEDIDALIDHDLPDRNPTIVKTRKEIGFEEEGEALVLEIERDIVDTLVHETALILIAN